MVVLRVQCPNLMPGLPRAALPVSCGSQTAPGCGAFPSFGGKSFTPKMKLMDTPPFPQFIFEGLGILGEKNPSAMKACAPKLARSDGLLVFQSQARAGEGDPWLGDSLADRRNSSRTSWDEFNASHVPSIHELLLFLARGAVFLFSRKRCRVGGSLLTPCDGL